MTASAPLVLLSSAALATAVFFGYHAMVGAWDLIARRHTAALQEEMSRLGFDQAWIEQLLRLWGASMIGAFVAVALVFDMPLVAALVVILLFRSARQVLGVLARRRRMTIRDQLVPACRALANNARAGLSLAQALEAVAKDTSAPLGSELQRIVRDYRQGSTFADSLKIAKDRLQLDSFTLLVVSTTVCQERGGNIAVVLERISNSLEELQRLERKRESNLASGRMLITVLGIFPFLFLGMFYLLDPEGTGLLFTTLIGQVLLCVVGALVFASVRWGERILATE